MNNELIDISNDFYYQALKNLSKLKEKNIYDELLYIVISQELMLFKKTINKYYENKKILQKKI